jgi:predicted lactoylglutathione lyase
MTRVLTDSAGRLIGRSRLYSAYFTDPEGHLWEVATGASSLPLSE